MSYATFDSRVWQKEWPGSAASGANLDVRQRQNVGKVARVSRVSNSTRAQKLSDQRRIFRGHGHCACQDPKPLTLSYLDFAAVASSSVRNWLAQISVDLVDLPEGLHCQQMELLHGYSKYVKY